MKYKNLGRRDFLRRAGIGAASMLAGSALGGCAVARRSLKVTRRPNVVFVFADQWRAQDVGYAGNRQVSTPNLDLLAGESINFTAAVSGCPVCCPYRASLLTGQYPLTHGVFLNDVQLNPDAVSIAKVYKEAGYKTGYVGKWHLNGMHRGAFIPKDERQGFDFWRAYGCTHNYNNSYYYADEDVKLRWEGYDAIAQTRAANEYIREHAGEPFVLFLSWGPPHAPYQTAPEKYRNMYRPEDIVLRPNVPAENRKKAREYIAGYYAHIAALDDCIGEILATTREAQIEEDTILVFTSDHGDMLLSQGGQKKQQPWDESILVPFLLRYPALLGSEGKGVDVPFGTPDIMPTLLGLSGIEVPGSVEGEDFSPILLGRKKVRDRSALISCPAPFGQWTRKKGGREYRGVRTKRYTYARDLNGPWLLYDNQDDPYQMNNVVNKPEFAAVQKQMEAMLTKKLRATNDKFLSGRDYIKKWKYKVDESGTVRYTN